MIVEKNTMTKGTDTDFSRATISKEQYVEATNSEAYNKEGALKNNQDLLQSSLNDNYLSPFTLSGFVKSAN